MLVALVWRVADFQGDNFGNATVHACAVGLLLQGVQSLPVLQRHIGRDNAFCQEKKLI